MPSSQTLHPPGGSGPLVGGGLEEGRAFLQPHKRTLPGKGRAGRYARRSQAPEPRVAVIVLPFITTSPRRMVITGQPVTGMSS